jgi:hypothetical protein
MAGGGSVHGGAGLAFAADEIGAATAALIIGAMAIVWAGMTATACGLALIASAARPAAVRRSAAHARIIFYAEVFMSDRLRGGEIAPVT